VVREGGLGLGAQHRLAIPKQGKRQLVGSPRPQAGLVVLCVPERGPRCSLRASAPEPRAPLYLLPKLPIALWALRCRCLRVWQLAASSSATLGCSLQRCSVCFWCGQQSPPRPPPPCPVSRVLCRLSGRHHRSQHRRCWGERGSHWGGGGARTHGRSAAQPFTSKTCPFYRSVTSGVVGGLAGVITPEATEEGHPEWQFLRRMG
jgi:hypothetical protein